MGYPRITLAPRAFNSGTLFDLTALTGGLAVGGSLTGYTGAEWLFFNNPTVYGIKAGTSGSMVPTLFADTGALPTWVQSVYRQATWTPEDAVNGGNPPSTGCVIARLPSGGLNKGVLYVAPAGRDLRTLTWIGQCLGGTFQAEAVLSDGSATTAPLVLTTSFGHCWFTCTYRALAEGTTLTLKIRRTAYDGSGNDDIYGQILYIGVPVKARGFKNRGA